MTPTKKTNPSLSELLETPVVEPEVITETEVETTEPDGDFELGSEDSEPVLENDDTYAKPYVDHTNYDLSGNGVTDNLPNDAPPNTHINVPSENATAIHVVMESVYADVNPNDDKGIVGE